jgi:hypothetical protein
VIQIIINITFSNHWNACKVLLLYITTHDVVHYNDNKIICNYIDFIQHLITTQTCSIHDFCSEIKYLLKYFWILFFEYYFVFENYPNWLKHALEIWIIWLYDNDMFLRFEKKNTYIEFLYERQMCLSLFLSFQMSCLYNY